MPLGFLVPAFLIAALAVGVPLLLHLRQRDRQQPVPFPSLRFLIMTPIRTERRRRINDWLLLILRASVIILLVAAFARPFLRTGDAALTGNAGLTVILIDRSASMGAAGVAESWRRAADSVIAAQPSGRRIAVVGFDTDAMVLSPPSADHSAARSAIGRAPTPAGGTRVGAGLSAAGGLLAGERIPGEVVLVSDMQQSARSSLAPPALPAGTALHTVQLSPTSRDNAAIVAVDIEPVAGAELRRAVIAARIARHGGTTPVERTIVLALDGRERGRVTTTLPADGSVRAVFDTVEFSRGAARLELWTDPDGLTSDDRFVAVIPASSATHVLLVVPSDIRPGETEPLERALAIGDDPRFVIERTTRINPAALARSQAAILYDVELDPAGELATWLASGGGLLAVAGDRLARGSLGIPALVGATHRTRDRPDGALIGGAVVSHPALSSLRGAGTSSLSQLRVRRYAVVDPAPGATVLARYDDGSPALIAATDGTGRALLSTIPLGIGAGDFPLQPTFLPFLRGVLGWLAGVDLARVAWPADEPWPVPASIRTAVVRGPNGDVLRPAAHARLLVLRESGFHEVFDAAADGVPQATVAVNAPAAESDLTPMTATGMLRGVSETANGPNDLAPIEVAAAREARQTMWRWLLLAVLATLTLEAIVASRGWRGVAVQTAAEPDMEGSQR